MEHSPKIIEFNKNIQVKKRIDRNLLKETFSLNKRLDTLLILGLEEEKNDEEEFADSIISELLVTKDYSKILKIRYPKSILISKIEGIINKQIMFYLDSRDDLPMFSTISDFAKYINAPENIIEGIIPKKKPSIYTYLPQPEFGDFAELFTKRLKVLFKEIKTTAEIRNNQYDFDTFKEIFTMIASNERVKDYENIDLEYHITKHFSIELNAIKKYHSDLKNWKSGIFDSQLLEAKNSNLSKIDTIILILETYIGDLKITE